VIEKRHLDNPETVIIHMGTNDLRTKRNIDFVLGRSICVGGYGKKEVRNCRLVLSGVLRRRDVLWSPVGALIDKYDWDVNPLGLNFVYQDIWSDDGDFARD
jgi:hypothetical protein